MAVHINKNINTLETSEPSAAAGNRSSTPTTTKTAVVTQQQQQELSFTLHVFNFGLPSVSKFKTAFGCDTKAMISGKYPTGGGGSNVTEIAELQRSYLELGLMHKVTFSNFLEAECGAEGGPMSTPEPDWDAVSKRWGK